MKTRAPNPRRAELKALSMELKPMVKAGLFDSVNEALIDYYGKQTGNGKWKTFKGWRDEGYSVVKGQQGFPIWGRPRNMAPGEGQPAGDLAQLAALNGIEPDGPEFFPVCYLFHAGQVDIAGVRMAA